MCWFRCFGYQNAAKLREYCLYAGETAYTKRYEKQCVTQPIVENVFLGMTLYYMPSHDSFAPALSETSTRGYDSASLRMEHIEPGDGSLRDSESVKTNCQRNFMRGRMRRAQRLLSPSPAEEYYRGQQVLAYGVTGCNALVLCSCALAPCSM